MDLPDALRLAEAPEALIEWAPSDAREAFERCGSGPWLIWIAGSSGFPLDVLLRCVMSLVDDVVDELDEDTEGRDLILDALDLAEDCLDGEASGEECLEVAEECELVAEEPPATYRESVPPGFVDLCRASAWIARAAEGFESSRRRLEAPRLEHAQHMGALLGAGSHVFVPAERKVAVNAAELPENETQAALLFVVAALAEAVRHGESARRELHDETAETAGAWTADRLRAAARDE